MRMSEQISAQELQQLLTECKLLREENAKLRNLLGMQLKDNQSIKEIRSNSQNEILNVNPQPLSAEAKIALFSSLFQGRDDVYALRWESKNNRTGYSPAYANTRWNRCQCQKPKVRCPVCNQLQFLPLTNQVIYDHLAGI